MQGTIVQGQTLSGQTVFIQGQAGGQASVVPGQTFMVQNQGQQSQLSGQMSLITTTIQQTPTSQSLQIVQQVGQQQQQQQSIGEIFIITYCKWLDEMSLSRSKANYEVKCHWMFDSIAAEREVLRR